MFKIFKIYNNNNIMVKSTNNKYDKLPKGHM